MAHMSIKQTRNYSQAVKHGHTVDSRDQYSIISIGKLSKRELAGCVNCTVPF